jgi:methyl-accepting chemotaxis protein
VAESVGRASSVATVSGEESDPLEELLAGIEEARDLTRQAAAAVRQLRVRARALERRCRAREREFESTGKLITRLQEAIGF